ncbi:MAG: hypothetical protein FJ102_26720 [Deltaproteobacteria bacterium]|nr:hypothetical protein [Deltaproteobacteria bacterium]
MLHRTLYASGARPPVLPGAKLPARVAGDPLPAGAGDDDPARALSDAGILAMDGGHFVFLVHDQQAASAIMAVRSHLDARLPGLRYEVKLGKAGDGALAADEAPVSAWLPEGVPQLELCQLSGRGVASATWLHAGETHLVSSASADRAKAGDRFADGETKDTIGRLQGAGILPLFGGAWQAPSDFNALCGNEYLAVVHADGNGIGRRQAAVEAAVAGREWAERESAVQAFFHAMRVAVREAVVKALVATFGRLDADTLASFEGVRPYQLLMLGGDDLLLVCRARFALPFLVNYARELAELPLGNPASPISIGAGVAIARPSVPFHRLHAVAERLADSAKRLYRGGIDASVADWAVFTGAWPDDPIDARRMVALGTVDGTRLVTSGRPLRVLRAGAKESPLASVQGLWERGRALYGAAAGKRTGRGQLRSLVEALRSGEHVGRMAFEELAPSAKSALRDAGVTAPWEELVAGPQGRTVLSRVPDLVEVAEIPRLGRARAADHEPGPGAAGAIEGGVQ